MSRFFSRWLTARIATRLVSDRLLFMDDQSSFLNAEQTLGWLGQFCGSDQVYARQMLERMLLVSEHAFRDGLRTLLADRLQVIGEEAALYAERELILNCGRPAPLFKQSHKRPCRAYGSGPQPVQAMRNKNSEVGSEGLVAQLITEIIRTNRKKTMSHPGPDIIRKRRIRWFLIVADFIGSGNRCWHYLDAAWQVRSVRSWWSLGLLHFEVFAFSGTEKGRSRIESHHCRPNVHLVQGCPTIDNSFPRECAKTLHSLCMKYDPCGVDPVQSLGYGGSGALIAFAHGIPNNAPRILYKKNSTWLPLFPSRVTAAPGRGFPRDLTEEQIRNKLAQMRERRLLSSAWLLGVSPNTQRLLLVLIALSKGPRRIEALSYRTGLTIPEVANYVQEAEAAGWVDSQNRLTDKGKAELAHLRSSAEQNTIEELVDPSQPYYPSMLRAPREISSSRRPKGR